MKTKFAGIFLILIFFSACQKEYDFPVINPERAVSESAILTPDQTHDVLAKVLSLSLSEPGVRYMLHQEIGKQFTGDYDIIFDLIRDREIESEKYGPVTFLELLKSVAFDHSIDFSGVEESISGYRNLQISSPVYYDDWDPATISPLVISLPVDYNEGENMAVKGYDNLGNESLFYEEKIHEPILLVRRAERVDSEGVMRVSRQGFVIPDEDRGLTVAEAYEWAEMELKSGRLDRQEPVIEVLDEADFQQALISRRNFYAEPEPRMIPMNDILEESGLKSANATAIAAPANFSVHPAGPYTIQVNWSQVPGAVSYEVFRQYGTGPNYMLAIANEHQINYVDQNLPQGARCTYSVRAVDAAGNRSVLTNGQEAFSTWRNNGSKDYIDKIYIDKKCWNWCCGLFDGKIELQFKTSYLTLPNTPSSYPASQPNNLGQKSSSQQKDKWCAYNIPLFPWDVRNNSYSYRFILIEDDASALNVTIKFGITFKVKVLKIVEASFAPNIEFKIANADEVFNEIIIVHWDHKGGSDSNGNSTLGYNLGPKKGEAKMYLK